MKPGRSGSPVIKTEKLSRKFKQVNAVCDLDLEIPKGTLCGLVGPDGAGKTTTLRLLAGLLRITSGSGSLLGFDLKTEAESIKSHIGYMAQRFSLYAELSVIENLRFFAAFYDLSDEEVQARMDRLLEFAGLNEFRSRRADHLSGGMQKKLALACTLIHNPEILILDEPTTGVDPISRREFWDILTSLQLSGTTILVSTPYMDEADRCTEVGLMYAGQMILFDKPEKIRARVKGEMLEIRTQDWRKAQKIIMDLPGTHEVQTFGESLHVLVDSIEVRQPAIEQVLQQENIPVREIRKAHIRMEEAFISLIKGMEN